MQPRSSANRFERPPMHMGQHLHTARSSEPDASTRLLSNLLGHPQRSEEHMALQVANPDRFDVCESSEFLPRQRDETGALPPGIDQGEERRQRRRLGNPGIILARWIHDHRFRNYDSSRQEHAHHSQDRAFFHEMRCFIAGICNKVRGHQTRGNNEVVEESSDTSEESVDFPEWRDFSGTSLDPEAARQRDSDHERRLQNAIAVANYKCCMYLGKKPQCGTGRHSEHPMN